MNTFKSPWRLSVIYFVIIHSLNIILYTGYSMKLQSFDFSQIIKVFTFTNLPFSLSELQKVFGLVAMTLLSTVLLIGVFSRISKRFAKYKQYQKPIGILSFITAIIHVLLTIPISEYLLLKRGVDLSPYSGLDPFVVLLYNPHVVLGAISFVILLLLIITSLRSVQQKIPHWKDVHKLVYFALFLAFAHMFLIEYGEGIPVRPFGQLQLILAGITILLVLVTYLKHTSIKEALKDDVSLAKALYTLATLYTLAGFYITYLNPVTVLLLTSYYVSTKIKKGYVFLLANLFTLLGYVLSWSFKGNYFMYVPVLLALILFFIPSKNQEEHSVNTRIRTFEIVSSVPLLLLYIFINPLYYVVLGTITIITYIVVTRSIPTYYITAFVIGTSGLPPIVSLPLYIIPLFLRKEITVPRVACSLILLSVLYTGYVVLVGDTVRKYDCGPFTIIEYKSTKDNVLMVSVSKAQPTIYLYYNVLDRIYRYGGDIFTYGIFTSPTAATLGIHDLVVWDARMYPIVKKYTCTLEK